LSHELEKADFLALPDRLCGSYRRLFDACQFTQDFPPPYSRETRETSTSPVQSRLTTLRFTRGMSWLRQYLLLQTGTGIDGRQEIPLGDNLIMAHPHASFEDVIQACKAAEIHEVIETLNDGYQTEIGERGTGLSGGQRQRIAIARALLKRPKILVFDEAVSNLDQQTAEHFARTINKLKGKVTMLFITHQIPRGLAVDEVIELGTNTTRQMEVVEEEK
jgi:ABC-type transport system involved in cytochrome bd biosynthesis fused ATPase/permease subunit